MKPLEFCGTDLEVLCGQLNDWRGQQRGRQRLPSEVWAAAARLAVTHGVSRVSRRLRLSFHRLRREREQSPQVPAGFVEMKWSSESPPWGASTGWVELVRGQDQMRIHTGHDPRAWAELARAFWERTA